MSGADNRKFITKMVKLTPSYSYPVRIELDDEEDILPAKKAAKIETDFMSNNQGMDAIKRDSIDRQIRKVIQDQSNREIFGD